MKHTLFLWALLVGQTMAFGQANIAPTHDHATTSLIDGAVHPELIPDSTAYRFVLVNLSELPNPSEEQKARQMAFLGEIGLSVADLQAAIPILTNFRVQHSEMIQQYNESVDLANKSGAKPDLATFLQRLDLLGETTLYELSSALSFPGIDRVHAYVQREKTKMKVPSKEVQ